MTSELQITETFYKHLYNFIKKHISEPKDVEDILHDALYKAQRNIEKIKDETKLSSWLFQIVRRAIIDFYRAKKLPVDLDDSVICSGPDPNPNQNKAIGNCLQDLIKQLPEKYRSALELTELKGISQVELSKQLGISNSGAKSRVQRGKKLLKDLLIQCCSIHKDNYGNVVDYLEKNPCTTSCGCRSTVKADGLA